MREIVFGGQPGSTEQNSVFGRIDKQSYWIAVLCEFLYGVFCSLYVINRQEVERCTGKRESEIAGSDLRGLACDFWLSVCCL